MNRIALPLALLAMVAAVCAEEVPAITVSKSDKLAIAITGLPAPDAKILQNDLALSGAVQRGRRRQGAVRRKQCRRR
jgi:hypothetical protein